MLHIPPTKVLISELLKTTTQSHTKGPTFREKEVQRKSGKENGLKAEKDKQDETGVSSNPKIQHFSCTVEIGYKQVLWT